MYFHSVFPLAKHRTYTTFRFLSSVYAIDVFICFLPECESVYGGMSISIFCGYFCQFKSSNAPSLFWEQVFWVVKNVVCFMKRLHLTWRRVRLFCYSNWCRHLHHHHHTVALFSTFAFSLVISVERMVILAVTHNPFTSDGLKLSVFDSNDWFFCKHKTNCEKSI